MQSKKVKFSYYAHFNLVRNDRVYYPNKSALGKHEFVSGVFYTPTGIRHSSLSSYRKEIELAEKLNILHKSIY